MIYIFLFVDAIEFILLIRLAKTSRDTKRFARDPRGIGRSKKDRGGSDVIGLADAAEWCLCFNAFAKIALVETGCAHSLRFYHARIAPSAANCLAMSAPIPFEAPVTTATFPFNFPLLIVFLSSFIFVFILLFLH